MEKNNFKKILLCVIVLIAIIICIAVVAVNRNNKDINDNSKNTVTYEEMPQDNTNMSEPSSSKQVGRIK